MHPETLFALKPLTLSRLAAGLPSEALRVAMLFDGHRRLWEVLRDSCLSGRMTMSVVGRLVSLGVLGEVGGAWAEPASGLPLAGDLPGAARAASEMAAPVMAAPAPPAPEPPAPETASPDMAVSEPPSPLMAAPAPPAPEPPAPDGSWEAFAHTMPVNVAQVLAAEGLAADCPATASPDHQPCLEVVSPDPASPALDRAQGFEPVNAMASFDEHEERFFASYEPEDTQVDTFWDLEDSPAKRLRARRLAQRLQVRRPQSAGWVRQLFSLW